MLEGVAKKKGLTWSDKLSHWKEEGQWHVEVYQWKAFKVKNYNREPQKLVMSLEFSVKSYNSYPFTTTIISFGYLLFETLMYSRNYRLFLSSASIRDKGKTQSRVKQLVNV